jgi:hypothetical protein
MSKQMFFSALSTALAMAVTGTSANAQQCPFEASGTSLAREGLVLTRYALSIRGSDLVANTGFTSAEAATIESTIGCADCGTSALDINGSGAFDVTDATIISRKIAGFSNAAATGGLNLGSGSRSSAAAVNSFLLAGCSGGGGSAWLQGGNAFGLPGLIATTDVQPLTVQSAGPRISLQLSTGDGLRVAQSDVLNAPNVVNGSSANNVTVGVRGATISGGGIPSGNTDPLYGGENPNLVTDHYSTTGGGYGNRAGNNNTDVSDAAFATVAGGNGNVASGSLSIVGGGSSNEASGYISAIVGGELNRAIDAYSFVGGGRTNSASGVESVVVGGRANASPGAASAILGGTSNNSAGTEAVVIGGSNNAASGAQAVAVGGFGNVANGEGSLAAGTKAKALQNGCFVWGDSLDANVECNAADAFVARARGGVSFYTAGSLGSYTGVTLPAGAGAWTTLSDANAKTGFEVINARAILDKLVNLPIMSWQYKAQGANVRHIGPTAQAFKASFGVGDTDRGISTVDADGIAFAAIKGLNEKLEATTRLLKQRDERIESLSHANKLLVEEVRAIKKRLGM